MACELMAWVLSIFVTIIVVLLIVFIGNFVFPKDRKIRTTPVNVIDGVTYPLPSDPRWKYSSLPAMISYRYQLGEEDFYVNFRAEEYGDIIINGITVANGKKVYYYGEAIRKSEEAHKRQKALSEACDKGLVRLPERA